MELRRRREPYPDPTKPDRSLFDGIEHVLERDCCPSRRVGWIPVCSSDMLPALPTDRTLSLLEAGSPGSKLLKRLRRRVSAHAPGDRASERLPRVVTPVRLLHTDDPSGLSDTIEHVCGRPDGFPGPRGCRLDNVLVTCRGIGRMNRTYSIPTKRDSTSSNTFGDPTARVSPNSPRHSDSQRAPFTAT